MFNVSKFLEKFKRIGADEREAKEVLSAELKKVKIDVDPKKITIRNGVAYLDLSPIAKNELFMRKQEILSAISQKIPNKIFDIR